MKPVLAVLAATIALSAASASRNTFQSPAVPSAECDSLWNAPATTGVTDKLREWTGSATPVWPGYSLRDGSFVVVAGGTADGQTCVGLWRQGAAAAYTTLPEPPKLLTPLYGYFLPWEPNGGTFDRLLDFAKQPQALRTWLESAGVETAIIVPVNVEGLPFEVSSLAKAQTAIHEAFHVEVQMPRWIGHPAEWPEWDVQPSRSTVRMCYSTDETVEAAFTAERAALFTTVTALLDDDRETACEAGQAFLQQRTARYTLIDDTPARNSDQEPMACEDAEAIMELEEGTADYASWTTLYNQGHVTRDRLIGRYSATQAEAFYLTGAMQWHAIYMMQPDGFLNTLAGVVNSNDDGAGRVTRVFATALENYCRL